jgi:hypothetical protein
MFTLKKRGGRWELALFGACEETLPRLLLHLRSGSDSRNDVVDINLVAEPLAAVAADTSMVGFTLLAFTADHELEPDPIAIKCSNTR